MVTNNKSRRGWSVFFLIAYLILLSYFLLFAEAMGRTHATEEYRYNLALFREIKRFWSIIGSHGWKPFLFNVVGNVLAFMPFGFLLPKVFIKSKRILLISLLSFELSLFAETLQLIFKLGCFDVDDLLLNTIGGILGFLFLWMVEHKKKS